MFITSHQGLSCQHQPSRLISLTLAHLAEAMSGSFLCGKVTPLPPFIQGRLEGSIVSRYSVSGESHSISWTADYLQKCLSVPLHQLSV